MRHKFLNPMHLLGGFNFFMHGEGGGVNFNPYEISANPREE